MSESGTLYVMLQYSNMSNGTTAHQTDRIKALETKFYMVSIDLQICGST